MEAEFSLPKHWSFELGSALPADYRGRILRGATVISAIGETGSIIIQTFEQPLFTIRFKIIEFFRSVKVPFKHQPAPLASFLALKNNINYQMQGIGAVKLKEGGFTLLHAAKPGLVARFEKNKLYQSLEINWSEEILRETKPFFKILDPLFNPANAGKSFFIGDAVNKTEPGLIDLANEILKSPYNNDLSELLFQNKVREYLFLILVATGRVPASGFHITEEQWKKMEEIAKRLTSEPKQRFPITKLASSVGMNTAKFKQGFKEKYNTGAFEYQMAGRMKEALRLLKETTLTVYDIATRVGYRRVGSFITKFREYHGYPPSKVERNNM